MSFNAPDIRQFKLTGSTVGDVYFPKTELLLPFDETNGSTSTTDSSNRNNSITFNGNAQISTAQSKFGGSSLLLDGAGDYLQVANQDYFDFGSNDFTIECWFYFDSSSSETYNTLLDMGNGNASGSGPFWTAVKKDSGTYYIGVALDTTTAGDWDVLNNLAIATLSASTWHHFAVSREGSNFKVFLNGTSVVTATGSSPMRDENSALQIGARGQNTASHYFKGYIDDVRITNGVARYTSNFTPPTTAHLTSAGDANKQIIVNSSADGVDVGTGGINQARIAKAWVRFDQTGSQSIDSSYNISSVTDTNTGISTLNFSTAMTDAEYSVVATGGSTNARYYASTWSIGTSSFQVRNFSVYDGSSLGEHYLDRADCSAIVFGN